MNDDELQALARLLLPYREQVEAAWGGRRSKGVAALPDKKSARYMRLDEVAHHLGYKDKASVYPLLTSHGGPIAVIATGPRRGLRVVRASFDAYCEAKEREAAQRFERGLPRLDRGGPTDSP